MIAEADMSKVLNSDLEIDYENGTEAVRGRGGVSWLTDWAILRPPYVVIMSTTPPAHCHWSRELC